MRHTQVFALILITYLALTTPPLRETKSLLDFIMALWDERVNLIVNLAAGLLVSLLGSRLWSDPEGMMLKRQRLPAFALAVARYIVMVADDVFRGGLSTAKIVLSRKMPINPGIIALDAGSKTEFGAALSAHAITLSPGEMVVAMDGAGTLYVHCLNVEHSAEYAQQAQDLRRDLLSQIFE